MLCRRSESPPPLKPTMLNPLLAYGINTIPSPLQTASTGTMTIVASNQNEDPGNNPVILTQISMDVMVGREACDLTLDVLTFIPPQSWLPGTPTTDGPWQVYPFTPQQGAGAIGVQGLAFEVNAFTVNAKVGNAKVRMTQTSQMGGIQHVPLTVIKAPAGWSDPEFWSPNPVIASGTSATLQWVGLEGAHFTISYLDGRGKNVAITRSGGKPLAAKGVYPGPQDPPLTLEQTTTFNLEVRLVIEPHQPPITATVHTTVTVHPSIP